jgi:REP element-mobilizing transposase RayT
MKSNIWVHSAKNPRLDQDLYSCSGQPVFITIRARKNTVPFLTSSLCEMMIETFLNMEKDTYCHIHVYCLMPDHFHFVISPVVDGVSVIQFTNFFKGKTTNLSWGLGWTGTLWQPRFLITSCVPMRI